MSIYICAVFHYKGSSNPCGRKDCPGDCVGPEIIEGEISQGIEGRKSKALCSTCQKREATRLGVCKICAMTAARARGKKLLEQGKVEKKKRTTKDKLVIDFSSYPCMSERLKDRAQEDFRSVEQQALYYINKGMGAISP